MKTSQLKRRRVRAILAGGAVLGVGAVVTMAAWSDSEFVSGAFASGTFNLVGDATGEGFSDHADSSSAAELAFSITAEKLTPGDLVTAPFAVALDEGTTYNADVILSSVGVSDLNDVTYEIIQTTDFGCDEATTGTPLVPANTPLGTVPAGTDFDLTAPVGETLSQVNLCFKVAAGTELNQGASGDITWEFAAQSQS